MEAAQPLSEPSSADTDRSTSDLNQNVMTFVWLFMLKKPLTLTQPVAYLVMTV